ncbi:MAG: WYL domain-containing protein [Clostridia bacterium]|nr:WYL domain-containing protein [Clostridia bacterium]
MENNLFEEIYSSYYNIIANTLIEVMNNPITDEYHILPKLTELAKRYSTSEGFEDDIGEIIIHDSNLINNGTAYLNNKPTLPLTTIQKRWLKSLLEDPRIKLFDIDISGLEDVEPLFTNEAIVYYDKFNDGDDYSNENYIKVFRTLLQAIKTHSKTTINKTTNRGLENQIECWPIHLEYSSKDDKFRVLVSKDGNQESYNLSTITNVLLLNETTEIIEVNHPPRTEILELEINDTNQNNIVERCMINFSDYKKETTRINQDKYHLKIYYNQSDERELIIRVLQMGSSIKVIGPSQFKERIVKRIMNQKSAN